ncbi:Fc.00g042960.m01.CDS01 [Cosmosporella sp. VM-42]
MHPPNSTTHESTDIDIVGTAAASFKPPLPTSRPRTAQSPNNAEVLVPPLVAGAIVAAFATALAEGLNNELLTHYYLPEQKVRINIDRVLDRLLAEFTKQLWDELWGFYCDANPEAGRQINLLFNGPICQLILILNGPETPRCILDKLGPGLSRRPATWSSTARGIDLQLSLQLLCSYWDREFAARSPQGSPDEIARSLCTYITTGNSARDLISKIREILVSPHFVQMHLMESAIWDILLKRPFPPPRDGFHIIQFKFECQLFGPLEGIGDLKLGSLPAITGTANDCIYTTVTDYVNKQWPKCGSLLLACVEEAVSGASVGYCEGNPFSGMSVWDGMDSHAVYCPTLRLIHVEVEDGSISLTVSAWTHTMIEILQQMAWTCAALSASPFPGAISECAAEISDWEYLNDSVFVNCSLSHRPVPEGDGAQWLKQLQGAAIANGFPINHTAPPAL